jgi:hypothetical protein
MAGTTADWLQWNPLFYRGISQPAVLQPDIQIVPLSPWHLQRLALRLQPASPPIRFRLSVSRCQAEQRAC